MLMLGRRPSWLVRSDKCIRAGAMAARPLPYVRPDMGNRTRFMVEGPQGS